MLKRALDENGSNARIKKTNLGKYIYIYVCVCACVYRKKSSITVDQINGKINVQYLLILHLERQTDVALLLTDDMVGLNLSPVGG